MSASVLHVSDVSCVVVRNRVRCDPNCIKCFAKYRCARNNHVSVVVVDVVVVVILVRRNTCWK